MIIKDRILELDQLYAKENDSQPIGNIDDILISFILKYQLLEPCKYIKEDDEWVTFIILSPDESFDSQILTLKKSEIISYGICSENNIGNDWDLKAKNESDGLYQ